MLEIHLSRDGVGRVQSRRRGDRVDQLLIVDTGHAHLEASREVDAALSLPSAVTFLCGLDPRCATKFGFEQSDRDTLVARPYAHVPEILGVPLASIELVIDGRAASRARGKLPGAGPIATREP